MTQRKDCVLMLEGHKDPGFLHIACHILFSLLQSTAFALLVSIY